VPDTLVVHVDGGARGNPGPAAVAAVVSTPEGSVLREASEFVGEATNNVAEYRAVLLGLSLARELGAREVELVNDSELVARQIGGQYKVKHAGLRPLYAETMEALRGFERWSVSNVARAQNARADELVNETLDERVGPRPQASAAKPYSGAGGEFRFVYRSSRFDATVEFWERDVGLERVGGWDRGEDDRGAIFALGAGRIEVILGEEDLPPSSGAWLLAEVDDVDGWYERLRERDVLILQEPLDKPWGQRDFGIVDPSGVVLYLFSKTP
jgi:ribonuclease HI